MPRKRQREKSAPTYSAHISNSRITEVAAREPFLSLPFDSNIPVVTVDVRILHVLGKLFRDHKYELFLSSTSIDSISSRNARLRFVVQF